MDVATHTFPGDEVSYITPTWADLQELSFRIAHQMRIAGCSFDRIVTLAKGGWPMTRCLVDFLELHEVASIGVKFYAGIHERFEHPKIYQDLPVAVVGERILLFDDVADTGTSLKFTYDYLLNYRGVHSLTTATLYAKPHSVMKPDFYGAETDAWIVFPYDAAEMIGMLGPKWREAGVAEAEIAERFRRMGFAAAWIDTFSKPPPPPA